MDKKKTFCFGIQLFNVTKAAFSSAIVNMRQSQYVLFQKLLKPLTKTQITRA
jgi:hypothetical protein